MNIAVTGGAGFIGSHLVDSLLSKGHSVKVIDDLSSGSQSQVNKRAGLVNRSILSDLSNDLNGVEAVFHFAADPDVRSSAITPEKSFDVNVNGTFSLLESCRKSGVKSFVLASTSTVYGEAEVIPTPETFQCAPISNYGASKLACEGYVSSYASTYGIRGTSLRLANIFGERSTHGVAFDFFQKLKKNPKELEILGNGKQEKSYLYVTDCVSAAVLAWEKQSKIYDVFNVGSNDKIDVTGIARLMCKKLNLNPTLNYTGTPRGWAGDVRLMHLDNSKLGKLGWKEKIGFSTGLDLYVSWLSKTY